MQKNNVQYKNEMIRGDIMGTTSNFMDFLNVYPEMGELFSDDAIKRNEHVAVIGWKIKDELFGLSDAVGEKVKIANQWYRIIGVFPKSGKVGMQDIDNMVLVPYTTVQKYLLGIDHFHAIMFWATKKEYVAQVAKDIELTVRELHDISDPDKDDFHVTTMEEATKTVGTIMGTITLLLSSVATISLVVGGIGIMNIMLVSVTERTREIGLRKALGGTSENILYQFLLESIILTAIGGAIGIASGAGLAFLITFGINNFTTYSWIFSFPIDGALIGLIVSAGVGIIFGLYPARQAAEKSPIEALRYE